MADSGAAMSGAIVSLGQTVSAYSFFLPPLREVRQAGRDDSAMRGDVRMGEVAAFAVTTSIAVMISSMVNSQVPLLTSLILAGVVFALYEIALNGERVME